MSFSSTMSVCHADLQRNDARADRGVDASVVRVPFEFGVEHRGAMNALEGVWRRHDPVVAPIPLVFDSPHSGEIYPADFDHQPRRDVVRQAEDTHVSTLWAHAVGVG